MDSWLDGEEHDDFVEVIDGDGETLGWLRKREASLLHLIPQIIETPPRYLEDPYISYHSQLAEERGLFKDGRDLNDIQVILLSGSLINRRKEALKEQDRIFEESMLINNPDLYKVYMEKKQEQEEIEGPEIEQRVPGSVEEFLATLESFSEGDPSDSDKEKEKAEGWLSSFLSDSDLSEMDD